MSTRARFQYYYQYFRLHKVLLSTNRQHLSSLVGTKWGFRGQGEAWWTGHSRARFKLLFEMGFIARAARGQKIPKAIIHKQLLLRDWDVGQLVHRLTHVKHPYIVDSCVNILCASYRLTSMSARSPAEVNRL